MGAIWIFFLVSPLMAAWNGDRPLVYRIIGVVLVLAFAVLYVGTLVYQSIRRAPPETTFTGIIVWSVLVLIAVAVIPMVELNSMSFLPFIVSFGAFVLPVIAAIGSLVVSVAITVIAPLSQGLYGEFWYFTIIVALVGIMTILIRVLDVASAEHAHVKDDLMLVAERERVARDVHDVLGHSLTVLTVKAELAERLIDVNPAEAKAELAQIRSITREALAEVRATVAGLRVARLGEELAAAREVLRSAGIDADVPQDPEVVDPRHRILFAWSLREATTNVVRHADARSCRVELAADTLRVVDDGRGITGAAEGNGLRGLRERVEQVGGRVELSSATLGGTVLEVRL